MHAVALDEAHEILVNKPYVVRLSKEYLNIITLLDQKFIRS